MSKTMGFRNSGKLDLSGKNMEYVLAGALLLIIVAAVVLAVGPMQCGRGSGGPMGEPRVKCVECGEEWEISVEEAGEYHREMEMGMGGAPIGLDCEKCKEKGCVFSMIQCPKCKKYYLSKRITDFDAFTKGGNKVICPHCDTDLHKWHKDHPRH